MASVSLLSSSSSSLLFNARPVSARSPSASLTCTRISASSVAGPTTSARPALLHCSFMPASSSLSFPSSLSGSPLQFGLSSSTTVKTQKRRSLVVRAGKKYALCQTKRNRSRKSLARTHGFRVRMRTTSGRALLKRRRAKGRWVLCPKSNPNSGKRHL